MNKKEGNIISFRVFIDSKGNLVTEFKKLPEKEIKNIFDELGFSIFNVARTINLTQ